MHTRASFDAAKDERTNINAEAVVTCDRASKYTRASSRTYLESSPTRSSRATRRLPEGSTVTPVHPTSILEERMVKKAIPSKQTNQEARLTMPSNSPSTARRVRAWLATDACKHTRLKACERRQCHGGSIRQRNKRMRTSLSLDTRAHTWTGQRLWQKMCGTWCNAHRQEPAASLLIGRAS